MFGAVVALVGERDHRGPGAGVSLKRRLNQRFGDRLLFRHDDVVTVLLDGEELGQLPSQVLTKRRPFLGAAARIAAFAPAELAVFWRSLVSGGRIAHD